MGLVESGLSFGLNSTYLLSHCCWHQADFGLRVSERCWLSLRLRLREFFGRWFRLRLWSSDIRIPTRRSAYFCSGSMASMTLRSCVVC